MKKLQPRAGSGRAFALVDHCQVASRAACVKENKPEPFEPDDECPDIVRVHEPDPGELGIGAQSVVRLIGNKCGPAAWIAIDNRLALDHHRQSLRKDRHTLALRQLQD